MITTANGLSKAHEVQLKESTHDLLSLVLPSGKDRSPYFV